MTTNRDATALTQAEIDARYPLWEAFSDVFLDTEMSDTTRNYIVQVILESEYSPQEVDDIFWIDVLPAVGDNLRSVAGEWAGFDEEWLKERIVAVRSGEQKAFSRFGYIPLPSMLKIAKEEWDRICRNLPSEYQDSMLGESNGYISAKRRIKPRWRVWLTDKLLAR